MKAITHSMLIPRYWLISSGHVLSADELWVGVETRYETVTQSLARFCALLLNHMLHSVYLPTVSAIWSVYRSDKIFAEYAQLNQFLADSSKNESLRIEQYWLMVVYS